MLLIYHYGSSRLPPSDAGVSYQTAYRKLSACIADSFSVTYNHAPYWLIAKTEDRQMAHIYPKVITWKVQNIQHKKTDQMVIAQVDALL
jgi:hypothetical protein